MPRVKLFWRLKFTGSGFRFFDIRQLFTWMVSKFSCVFPPLLLPSHYGRNWNFAGQKSNSSATKNRGNFTNWRLQTGTNSSELAQVRIIVVSNICRSRLQSSLIFFVPFFHVLCIVFTLNISSLCSKFLSSF